MGIELIHDERDQTAEMLEMGKVARLATNAAKQEIMGWSERFDDDVDKMSMVIVVSVQVATDVIEAALKLDDHGFGVATLHQTEQTLLPMLDKLRAKLAAEATKQ